MVLWSTRLHVALNIQGALFLAELWEFMTSLYRSYNLVSYYLGVNHRDI